MPTKIPAKSFFSSKYGPYGICGALGFSDQGLEELDMAKMRAAQFWWRAGKMGKTR
jgi:hypothetical protein